VSFDVPFSPLSSQTRRRGHVLWSALAAGVVLIALAAPAARAEGTVTVSVQGKGDVTGIGVDCNESGGPDCSEFYEQLVYEECIEQEGKPPRCFLVREDPYVEFVAAANRDGYVYQGWDDCDTVA
jgi:hypothetical protein